MLAMASTAFPDRGNSKEASETEWRIPTPTPNLAPAALSLSFSDSLSGFTSLFPRLDLVPHHTASSTAIYRMKGIELEDEAEPELELAPVSDKAGSGGQEEDDAARGASQSLLWRYPMACILSMWESSDEAPPLCAVA